MSTAGRWFVAALVLVSVFYFPLALDRTLAPRYLLLAVILFIACFSALFLRRTMPVPAGLPLLFYILYCCFVALSVSWSHNTAEAIFSAGRQVLGCLVLVVAVTACENAPRQSYRVIFAANSIVAAIILLVIIAQFIQVRPSNKEEMYGITGLSSHKNLLSSFLFLSAGIFILQWCDAATTKQKLLAGSGCVVLVLIILGLRTKAAWLGITAAAAFALLFVHLPLTKRTKKNRLVHLGVLVFLGNIIWLFAAPGIVDLLLNMVREGQLSISSLDLERLQLWERSVQMFRQYPLTGVGAGNWQIHFPSFGLGGIWRAEEQSFSFQRPHNDFFWVLSESGIIGFNLYVFALAGFLQNATAGPEPGSRREKIRSLVPAAILSGYLVISCFDFPKERIEHTVWLHIILAITGVRRIDGSGAMFLLRPPAKVAAMMLCLLLTVVGVYRIRGEFFTMKLYFPHATPAVSIAATGDKACSMVYNMDPTSVPIAWYTGNAFAAEGRYGAALTEFEKAYSLHPFNHRVINDLASARGLAGDTARAKMLYRKAAEISPRFDEPRLNLAAIAIREQNYLEAKKWLNTLKHNSQRRQQYEAIVRFNLR